MSFSNYEIILNIFIYIVFYDHCDPVSLYVDVLKFWSIVREVIFFYYNFVDGINYQKRFKKNEKMKSRNTFASKRVNYKLLFLQ